MSELIKEYILFPTVDDFERFFYAVAYSPRVPSHIQFKRSQIRIWRDYRNNFIRVGFNHPIYSSIVRRFLHPNETIKVFRPMAYYVLQHDMTNQEDQLLMVESQIARIQLGEPSRVQRACELLKHYLYYTTFTTLLQTTGRLQRPQRPRVMDGLEALHGYY